jgi:hypothetical protein
MASIYTAGGTGRETNYRRRISNHIAFGLVTFAMLQIFIVASHGGSLIANLAIILVIAASIPGAHTLERRWELLNGGGLPSAGLATRYRRDVLTIWMVDLLVPFLWIPLLSWVPFLGH